MLTFRRSPRPPAEVPAWLASDGCAEFRAVGLELQLIDAVERRDRFRRGGVGDLSEIDAEVADLQAELARAVSG